MEQASNAQITLRPGRPREFDTQKALDDAVTLFSRKGYSASSIADISKALKLTTGSIYKAFKDKRGLFSAALQRYASEREERISSALRDAPSGRAGVRRLLLDYANLSQGESGRTGCLIVASAVEFGASDPPFARQAGTLLKVREQRLRRLIERGQADGSIGGQINAGVAARTLTCLMQGMRVLGKTGRNHAEMMEVVEQAMRLLD
jgi:AcrR family transcriptional regulator